MAKEPKQILLGKCKVEMNPREFGLLQLKIIAPNKAEKYSRAT